MSDHIWIGIALLVMFISGIAFGVGEVAPWLHRRHLRKLLRPMQVAKTREPPPVTTIVPLMVALDGGAKWRRLEIPTVKRRRRTEQN